MDLDSSNTDVCYLTAVQPFEDCGATKTGTVHVDPIMDKFAPFVKTYNFNFKCGQVPQNSDSGISNDGFQLVEELQCKLREKSHLANQLRSQLDFTDRQYEEALLELTAERDSLRTRLNILREENASLAAARRDCEEACERLCGCERELDETRRELDALRRRARAQADLIPTLEGDKLTLQELLSKSKEECHRINEMYASRQSNLLELNEALRSQAAELSAKLTDQDDLLQQLLRDKVILEMELKDMLNKLSQAPSRLDRSDDVSYTEEQMLSAIGSFNADSRFVPDEESFMKPLKDDPGRYTNMSIFDELREEQVTDVATQTDDYALCTNNNSAEILFWDCQFACLDCAKLKDYNAKLESDIDRLQSNKKDMLSEITSYEDNIQLLQNEMSNRSCLNERLQDVVATLEAVCALAQTQCQRDTAECNHTKIKTLYQDAAASCQLTKYQRSRVSSSTDNKQL